MDDDNEGPRVPSAPQPWAAIVALVITVGLVVATGVYNTTAAPRAPVVMQASIIPLSGGSTSSATLVINISSPEPAIGAHYLLDPVARLVVPLDGKPPFALEMNGTTEVVADRDVFVWVERGGTSIVRYYDVPRGVQRTVQVPPNRDPIAGTLVAGGGLVAWSYNGSQGTARLAGFVRGPDVVGSYAAAPENRTALAALLGDVYYTTSAARDDLWVFNLTSERSQRIGLGVGGANVSVGSFFAVWVNRTAGQAEYFDRYDRVVRPLPVPEGVDPRWALADDLTVLLGGIKKGFIFSSPRVEFYDFGTGNSHIYESVGVDFDATPYFGYGDRVVVTVEGVTLSRPVAPLTPYFLGAIAVATAITVLLAARELGRPEP